MFNITETIYQLVMQYEEHIIKIPLMILKLSACLLFTLVILNLVILVLMIGGTSNASARISGARRNPGNRRIRPEVDSQRCSAENIYSHLNPMPLK